MYMCQIFSGVSVGKGPACQLRRHKRCRFDPWVGKIPGRRAWPPTPVFLEKSPLIQEPGGLHRASKHWTRLSTHTHVYVSTPLSPFFLPFPPPAVSATTSSCSSRSVVSNSFSCLEKIPMRKSSYLINDTSPSSPFLLPERKAEMCMVLLESFCPPPFLSHRRYNTCVISDFGVCRHRPLRAGARQTEATPSP